MTVAAAATNTSPGTSALVLVNSLLFMVKLLLKERITPPNVALLAINWPSFTAMVLVKDRRTPPHSALYGHQIDIVE